MDKQSILKNIDEAIRLVTEQPEQLFDLSVFKRTVDCGTLHCTAGLLCTSAHFRALGWEWAGRWVNVQGVSIEESGMLYTQFGPAAYSRLFNYRDASPFDDHKNASNHTDKELALHRLAEQRKIVEAM